MQTDTMIPMLSQDKCHMSKEEISECKGIKRYAEVDTIVPSCTLTCGQSPWVAEPP